MEMLRYELLAKAIPALPDRDAHPVTAFQDIADDKCAGRWMLAAPGPDLGLTSPVNLRRPYQHIYCSPHL